ncbi:glycosyltransferase family 4 protein [Candidatus Kaiserbacteria bacterium]|nr:glycosyltransferase family 4 protein [Candidatus Kaiserbacteria bacterium]
MKRVLIFSLTYHPYVGGAEVALKEVTDRIDPAAYQFDMITLRFDKNLSAVEKLGNVTVHRIGFTADAPKISDRRMPLPCKIAKILFPLTSFLKAVSLHQRNHYDAIWAMMANYAAFGALAFKATHPRVPYLLELQDGNSLAQVKERQPVLRTLWLLYRQLYLRADRIKAISSFIEKLTREIGYTGPVSVIPNAVDTSRFAVAVPEEEKQALKARYQKSIGDIFLFTASRLVLSRGVEDVIRALPHLPLEVKFLVAGDGQDREKLEAIAKEAGVEGRVIFAGHVDHTQLPGLLQISDIFVRPSIIEGFGNAFVEAFAAGIPVVATPVGGIPDFLFDPETNPDREPTGVFCKVQDPESVAVAVRRYLDDPALVARVVRNARTLALEQYDWKLIAKQQVTFFNDATEHAKTP